MGANNVHKIQYQCTYHGTKKEKGREHKDINKCPNATPSALRVAVGELKQSYWESHFLKSFPLHCASIKNGCNRAIREYGVFNTYFFVQTSIILLFWYSWYCLPLQTPKVWNSRSSLPVFVCCILISYCLLQVFSSTLTAAFGYQFNTQFICSSLICKLQSEAFWTYFRMDLPDKLRKTGTWDSLGS